MNITTDINNINTTYSSSFFLPANLMIATSSTIVINNITDKFVNFILSNATNTTNTTNSSNIIKTSLSNSFANFLSKVSIFTNLILIGFTYIN